MVGTNAATLLAVRQVLAESDPMKRTLPTVTSNTLMFSCVGGRELDVRKLSSSLRKENCFGNYIFDSLIVFEEFQREGSGSIEGRR